MKKVLNLIRLTPCQKRMRRTLCRNTRFYPESEDIYIKFKKDKNMNPEDISKVKEIN